MGCAEAFAAAGRVALTLYVFQFIVAWALMLMGIDVTGIDIGGFLFGDILIAAGVRLLLGSYEETEWSGGVS